MMLVRHCLPSFAVLAMLVLPEAGASGEASAQPEHQLAGASAILSIGTLKATQEAKRHYAQLVERGEWVPVPTGEVLKIGVRHPHVALLRNRLNAEEALDTDPDMPEEFDAALDTAVKRFQMRHGLIADGVVSESTFDALNIPAAARLHQLDINLQRLAALSDKMAGRFVVVNIPGAEVEAVDEGRAEMKHVAVVGRPDRQSPQISASITAINFHPYWHVPASIVRKDLVPSTGRIPTI